MDVDGAGSEAGKTKWIFRLVIAEYPASVLEQVKALVPVHAMILMRKPTTLLAYNLARITVPLATPNGIQKSRETFGFTAFS
jgi:hypothetical protein